MAKGKQNKAKPAKGKGTKKQKVTKKTSAGKGKSKGNKTSGDLV